MKHATAETLAALSSLIMELRQLKQLVERTPGCFYLKSQAFLHFHEDPAGIFADVKLDLATFTRMCVTSRAEQAALLAKVRRSLSQLVAAKSTLRQR